MVASGNGSGAAAGAAASADRGGRYIGGRVGFAAGPFDVSFAAGQQKCGFVGCGVGVSTLGTFANVGDNQKTYNIGGSWDFGVAKIMGYYDRETAPNSAHENMGSISAVIPFGQSEVHVGYDRSKMSGAGVSSSVDQIKATYQYNLSKRTALYATASRLANKDTFTRLTLPGAAGATTAGGKSSGAEFGLRHFF